MQFDLDKRIETCFNSNELWMITELINDKLQNGKAHEGYSPEYESDLRNLYNRLEAIFEEEA